MRLICITLALFISGCISQNGPQNHSLTLIDSKSEKIGDQNNKMDLYTCSGELNFNDLKDFCLKKRKKFKNGSFYYLVVFDSREHAVFPTNPFSARDGWDREAEEHIRAIFVYNRITGNSELHNYE